MAETRSAVPSHRTGTGAGFGTGLPSSAITRKGQQALPTRNVIADLDSHLGRIGVGYEVDQRQKVEELFSSQPPASPDDLILHHRDMRRWPTEGCGPQTQKEQCQLAQNPLVPLAGNSLLNSCVLGISRIERPGSSTGGDQENQTAEHGEVGSDVADQVPESLIWSKQLRDLGSGDGSRDDDQKRDSRRPCP